MKFKIAHMFRNPEPGTGGTPVWRSALTAPVITYALTDRKHHALGVFTDLMQMYSFVLHREDRSAIWRVHGPDELAGYTDPDGLPAYYLLVERT
jgi:hypothetical protein